MDMIFPALFLLYGARLVYEARPELMASRAWWDDEGGFFRLFVGVVFIALGAAL